MERRSFLSAGCWCCFGALAAPYVSNAAEDAQGLPQALELGMMPMTRLDKTVWVSALAPQLWLFTVTNLIEGNYYYPANGVIFERPGGSVLIDTGYRPDQAETLLEWS